jgi:hypothetical protein
MAQTRTTKPRASTPARIMGATLLRRSHTANPLLRANPTDGEKNRATFLFHPAPKRHLFSSLSILCRRPPDRSRRQIPIPAVPDNSYAAPSLLPIRQRPAGVRFLACKAPRVPPATPIGPSMALQFPPNNSLRSPIGINQPRWSYPPGAAEPPTQCKRYVTWRLLKTVSKLCYLWRRSRTGDAE